MANSPQLIIPNPVQLRNTKTNVMPYIQAKLDLLNCKFIIFIVLLKLYSIMLEKNETSLICY